VFLSALQFLALVCCQLLIGDEAASANCILILPCADIDRRPVECGMTFEVLNDQKSN